MRTFNRLLAKELANAFLDRRFLVIFGVCAILSGLSVTLSTQDYQQRLAETQHANESSRNSEREYLESVGLYNISRTGYFWSRPPEKLSPLVYGQTGTQPREAQLRFRKRPSFRTSHFATDPINAMYGVLDLHFIVTVVISLSVLLFTHDAVCGEKQDGTLRLTASFPVSRALLATSKIVGSTISVLIPVLFAFLLATASLSMGSQVDLTVADGARILGIFAAFALCLATFAAIGVLVSSLVSRRITAFILLMVFWAAAVFAAPNLADRVARAFVSIPNHYDKELEVAELVGRFEKQRSEEWEAYWETQNVSRWQDLSEERQQEINQRYRGIEEKWTERLSIEELHLEDARRNLLAHRIETSRTLAMLLPVGAATLIAEDLAGTGAKRLEQQERALVEYSGVLDRYVREKYLKDQEERILTDFPWFQGVHDEPVGSVLERNVAPTLALILLVAVCFACAYVAIIRYDVR